VRIPPLRERGEDCLLLARWFLARKPGDGAQEPRLRCSALAAIAAYQWPGNVRELQNRVRRAALMADGALIAAADLKLPTRRRHGRSRAGAGRDLDLGCPHAGRARDDGTRPCPGQRQRLGGGAPAGHQPPHPADCWKRDLAAPPVRGTRGGGAGCRAGEGFCHAPFVLPCPALPGFSLALKLSLAAAAALLPAAGFSLVSCPHAQSAMDRLRAARRAATCAQPNRIPGAARNDPNRPPSVPRLPRQALMSAIPTPPKWKPRGDREGYDRAAAPAAGARLPGAAAPDLLRDFRPDASTPAPVAAQIWPAALRR
jgi:hypothetical protein